MRAFHHRRQEGLSAAIRGCWGHFTLAGLFSIGINLLWLTPFLFMYQIMDRVLTSRSIETLVYLLIAAGLAYLTLSCLTVARSQVLTRASVRLDNALSARLVHASVVSDRGSAGSPQYSQSIRDLASLRDFLTSVGIVALFDAPWFLVFSAVLALAHPWLGVMTFGGGFVLLLLAIVTDLVTRASMRASNGAASQSYGMLDEMGRNAEAIRAMGMLSSLRARWAERHLQALAAQILASDRAGTLQSISKLVRISLQSGILALGAWLVLRGEVTPGIMFGAAFLLGRALVPMEQVVGAWRSLHIARSAYRRLKGLLDTVPVPDPAMPLPKPEGYLSVEGVTYIPPGAIKPTLTNIRFHLDTGEMLGLIGPSGSGKSTLLRVIVGYLKARQGVVRLDGADLAAWDLDDIGNHIGYLPQDSQLFAGTVRDNIARFAEHDSATVIEAAKRAGVHEMILRLPDGYDTEIGDGGNRLSGGQRQRIALARALFGAPSLVLLDEPNSNLDTEGELALIQALADLKARKVTTIIVSHKPSLLVNVDKVLVLANGTIDQFGPRSEIFRIKPGGKGVRVA